jgi:hypothetical protein
MSEMLKVAQSALGHKYWSQFQPDRIAQIETLAKTFYELLFGPAVTEPIKTLDIPLGGSVSPVDALALLIEDREGL